MQLSKYLVRSSLVTLSYSIFSFWDLSSASSAAMQSILRFSISLRPTRSDRSALTSFLKRLILSNCLRARSSTSSLFQDCSTNAKLVQRWCGGLQYVVRCTASFQTKICIPRILPPLRGSQCLCACGFE